MEGEDAQELAVVLSGTLAAEVDDRAVGQVREGELVGEGAAFLRAHRRIASVRAATDSVIASLRSVRLRQLRREGSPVYDALLSQALVCMARRIKASARHITRLAQGDMEAPKREETNTAVKMWRKLVAGRPGNRPPPVEPLVRGLPGLHDVPDNVMKHLCALFVEEPMEDGQVICMQAEKADCAWLVAEGELDVLRHVSGTRASWLTTMGPGDFFGANALVDDERRGASVVAVTKGWMYRIDRNQFENPPPLVGNVLHEAMLATLATQLERSNRVLRDALDGPDEASLLRSMSHLNSFDSRDVSLDSVDLAVTFEGTLDAEKP
jgi:CRP-like cAMP-binding protein